MWVKAKQSSNEISFNWKLHNYISVFNLIIINNVLASCARPQSPALSSVNRKLCCNLTHRRTFCSSSRFLVCTLNLRGGDVTHFPREKSLASGWSFTNSSREREVRSGGLVQSTPGRTLQARLGLYVLCVRLHRSHCVLFWEPWLQLRRVTFLEIALKSVRQMICSFTIFLFSGVGWCERYHRNQLVARTRKKWNCRKNLCLAWRPWALRLYCCSSKHHHLRVGFRSFMIDRKESQATTSLKILKTQSQRPYEPPPTPPQ